jgi:hypothetical protein
MASQDTELDALFLDDHLKGTHERRQSGRTMGAGDDRLSCRLQHGGVTITLRIKPDRRRVVTRVDPENERRGH